MNKSRPAGVTLVGWIWIVLGCFMCLSSLLGLFGALSIMQNAQFPDQVSWIVRIAPYMVAVQIAIGLTGLISGIQFIHLKSWSRAALEWSTWIVLVILVCFMVYWIYNWISVGAGQVSLSFSILFLTLGILMIGVYAVPLGFMLRYLRNRSVRQLFCRNRDGATDFSRGIGKRD